MEILSQLLNGATKKRKRDRLTRRLNYVFKIRKKKDCRRLQPLAATHTFALYTIQKVYDILSHFFEHVFPDKKIRFWWKNRKVLEPKHPLFIRSNAPRHSKYFV